MAAKKKGSSTEERTKVVAEHLQKEGDTERLTEDALRHTFLDHLLYSQVKDASTAQRRDLYVAAALTVRDRMVRRWIETRKATYAADPKRVYYLSLEFLMGRALSNNLINLGIHERVKNMLGEVGINLPDLLEQEPDPGLGNGGLGRLAACYLDSMATLGIPGWGYGIRYEFGIFDQAMRNGWQVERPDQWLALGNPWEQAHPEYRIRVRFYGRCVSRTDEAGKYHVDWVDTRDVVGTPFDTPIVGYGNGTVNTLRLWQARASEEFDLQVFNDGDYLHAVQQKELSETISKVLYPNDASPEGRELRLKQQYFFVACSLHDIVRRYRLQHTSFAQFADKVAIQLNDTHPAIAIPELMRILMDTYGMPWDDAWKITTGTFAYTNHTLLTEALESWRVSLMEKLLPRHLQIIQEINRRFLASLTGTPLDSDEKRRKMSIISDSETPHVRMAHLAIVGSHAVNGVAELHTELVKRDLFPDFHFLWPKKIVNRTNGVTPRRWLLSCNPALSSLITEAIGDQWPTHLDQLRKLEPMAEDKEFRRRFAAIKLGAKQDLAQLLKAQVGLPLEPTSMFDVHVKRIHEYKRQLLNVLHAIALYRRIQRDPRGQHVPRSILIGGKAAPGYVMAKLIIKLVSSVGDIINKDPLTRDLLRVVFVPNYRVSLAERIFPASNLSQQISTAGKEASGTGNMKFALNGALTIGTLDGANVEMREEVGADNFFLFGLTAQQVAERKARGYEPSVHYQQDAELRGVIDAIAEGVFSPREPALFQPLVNDLMGRDEYLLLADFRAYVDAQRRVDEAWLNPEAWNRMCILNIARMGKFSSDRAVTEYAEGIWGAKPIHVPTT